MKMSREFVAACLLSALPMIPASGAVADANPFRAADYAALRKQLRAFHPDECRDECKDPAYTVAWKAINADLDAYAAANPGYDALDLRQACCRSMQKHFVPFLFTESPFYFEAGVNGGDRARVREEGLAHDAAELQFSGGASRRAEAPGAASGHHCARVRLLGAVRFAFEALAGRSDREA